MGVDKNLLADALAATNPSKAVLELVLSRDTDLRRAELCGKTMAELVRLC